LALSSLKISGAKKKKKEIERKVKKKKEEKIYHIQKTRTL